MKNISKYLLALMLLSTTLYAQVGINKGKDDSTIPVSGSMLDVNGDVIVRHPDTNVNENTYNLYRNTTTGEIVRGQIANTRPIYIIEYKLHMYKNELGYQDWISYYNTKINAHKYYAFVVESTLYDETTGQPTFMRHNSEFPQSNAIKQIKLSTDGNVWALSADYPSSYPAASDHPHYWKIKVVAIDNDYIRYIDGKYHYMNESTASAVAGSPAIKDKPIEIAGIDSDYKSKGAVGIGTDEPQTELDVNGKMNVRSVPDKSSISELYPLLLEKDSKHLVAFPNQEPVEYITGRINCNSQNPGWNDYINDFDLGIPKKSGTVIPVNTFLGNKYYDDHVVSSGYKAFYGIAHHIIGSGSYNAVESVQTKTNSETDNWHFSADYAAANPVCGVYQNRTINNVNDCKGTYYWNVGLLFLSSNIAKDLGEYEDYMEDNNRSKNDPQGQLNIINYLLGKQQ